MTFMGGQCDEKYQKNSDCYASLPLFSDIWCIAAGTGRR